MNLFGLILFVLATLVLWWALQRQLEDAPVTSHDHRHTDSDDLTKIEGIGAQSAGLLNKEKIATFAGIAEELGELPGNNQQRDAVEKADQESP